MYQVVKSVSPKSSVLLKPSVTSARRTELSGIDQPELGDPLSLPGHELVERARNEEELVPLPRACDGRIAGAPDRAAGRPVLLRRRDAIVARAPERGDAGSRRACCSAGRTTSG